MLNPIVTMTNRIVASFEVMWERIDECWAETRRRLDGGREGIERDYFIADDVPDGRLSHDVEVMPAAASKSKKVDYSKMSLAKLRNAYVEMFDEKPDGRLKEASLREYLENAE